MKKSFYIYNTGSIKRKDNSITFIDSEGNRKDIPIEQVDDLYIMSEMTLNTKLLNLLAQHNIAVHFFNYYSFYTGSFLPRRKYISGSLLVKQVECYLNSEERLKIARSFVEGASYNIYRNLRYYNGRGKNLQEHMDSITELMNKLPNARTVNELMGYEGNIHKIYYSAWPIIINQDVDFEKRVKHPPDNMVNTLISYVNTLIYTRVLSEIYKTQLDPTISYLHEPGTRRFSLSLDIAEIFKPLIGDRVIFSLLNKNQITEKSFTKGLDYLHLNKKSSQLITSEVDKCLQRTIQHKDLNKTVSYQYLMRLECYKLIKHFVGEKEYSPFKIWW